MDKNYIVMPCLIFYTLKTKQYYICIYIYILLINADI